MCNNIGSQSISIAAPGANVIYPGMVVDKCTSIPRRTRRSYQILFPPSQVVIKVMLPIPECLINIGLRVLIF